ncbi:unnamed protein product [Adineta steineri]|uniref:Uncharacterized protein n=1 Tax=Adineta steineri TaxID=433720 RepID=A0A814Z6R3_9BILA|nr:unnamed protein product [Adineta steineri]CAF1239808.1 unnamed protein product [Adineta steineri]
MKCCDFIDGYQWEDLIRNHLPKLRTFHLSMGNLSIIRPMTEEQIDEFMNSFGSSFWIDEHRWFVQCMSNEHFIRFGTNESILFY